MKDNIAATVATTVVLSLNCGILFNNTAIKDSPPTFVDSRQNVYSMCSYLVLLQTQFEFIELLSEDIFAK